jgi:hypothetical protein
LQRIEHQAPEQRELARRVLSWVFRAKRALSTGELQHAVVVDMNMKHLDRDFLPDVELLDALCVGLVTVDKETNVVRLVHYTTQVFFEKRHDFLRSSHSLLARTCITYLSFDGFAVAVSRSPDEFEDRLSKYDLFIYTATEWAHHLRSYTLHEKHDKSLINLVLQFLGNTQFVDSAFILPYIMTIAKLSKGACGSLQG